MITCDELIKTKEHEILQEDLDKLAMKTMDYLNKVKKFKLKDEGEVMIERTISEILKEKEYLLKKICESKPWSDAKEDYSSRLGYEIEILKELER